MNQDRIYSLPLSQVGDFEFDAAVTSVFPDMIRRSVPGYASMLSMIGQCAKLYVVPNTSVYDLGCSLGAATFIIRENVPASCVIHAVDSSPSMIAQLQQSISRTPTEGCAIELHEADIREVHVQNASMVVLNLTLQFIAPEHRLSLLQNVAAGMRNGAALVLSEKVRFDDADQQTLMTDFHHEFKRTHGYSDLEIAQKRTAIENRLHPETLETHVARLKQAGFRTVCPWFQCFNFVSILAIRQD